MVRRLAAVGALACLVVGAWATPAFGHAVLEGTDPGAGATVRTSPEDVVLTFTEPVEVALGGVRAYDSRGRRLDVGDPTHPDGAKTVAATLPDLDDGTYVVTWRVLSADSHPIRGAFTFTVGSSATTALEANSLAQRLLTDEGGSTAVGILLAVVRFAAFGALAVLVGGALFLALVWSAGRNDRRARRLLWAAWGVGIGAALLAFALEGPYVAALGLTKVADPSLWSEVATTRLGQVLLLRIALLLLALPLLRALLPTRAPAVERPLPGWWAVAGAVLGLALCATPGLGGHASSGPLVPVAIGSDTLHVAGVAAWLGGLVVLFAALMPRADEATLRETVPRYSQFALVAVGVIVATGVFQSFRQVDRFGALLDTDFGRLLLIKVCVFLVLMVVAAVSRDVVNRRWRIPTDQLDAPEPVGATVGAAAGGATGSFGSTSAGGGPSAPGAGAEQPSFPEGYVLDEPTAEKRLRRSLVVEVLISIVILGVTALLVNAAPARDVDSGPFVATLRAGDVSFDVTVTPARRGNNEMHLFTLGPDGTTTDPTEVTAELTQPENDIAPIELELVRLAPGHYTSTSFTVPFAGDWELTLRAVVDEVDSESASATVPISSS
jgi:copper transport protein